tara:strand:+ start:3243 stop:4544 length:1302 start_codon:yes stop_codon:yes gene_type:complete
VSKSKIKKRPYRGLFLLLVLISSLYSKKAYNPQISAIEFKGNMRSLDHIIEREIQHPLNASLDSTIANEDRNRLENLGIFSEVFWRSIPLEDGTAVLNFTLKESLQKTPPIALPNFKEDTGWSLVGFWLINNFRGRNQSLIIGGSIGGEDTYGISFSDPWIFGNHVSLDFQIGRTIYKHRFLNRYIDVNSLKLNFGKWFGEHIKSSAGFELESKIFRNSIDEDKYFYLAPFSSIRYDTRDIFWNPGRGVQLSQFFYYNSGIDPKNIWTFLWNQSYSWFVTLNKGPKKLVLAMNGSANRKFGNKEELWLNYFGGSSTVRGWALPDTSLYYSGNESFRFGHEFIHASTELRYEAIPKYATSLGTELGLVFVLFSDVGMMASTWNTLRNQLPVYGAGFGVRIPFPLVNVVRIDYGWGYRNGFWNSGSIHWGFEQKF